MQDWNLRWIGRENRSREVWPKEKRKILTEIYYLMIGRDDGGDDQDYDDDADDDDDDNQVMLVKPVRDMLHLCDHNSASLKTTKYEVVSHYIGVLQSVHPNPNTNIDWNT